MAEKCLSGPTEKSTGVDVDFMQFQKCDEGDAKFSRQKLVYARVG